MLFCGSGGGSLVVFSFFGVVFGRSYPQWAVSAVSPAPVNTKNVFAGFLKRRGQVFCAAYPPRGRCGPYFEVIALTELGNHAVRPLLVFRNCP